MGFRARVAGLAAVIAADICLAGVLAAVAAGGSPGGHAENVIPEGPPAHSIAPVSSADDDSAASIPRYLALTFDDGPHGEYTEFLLDGLRERGVKATFFLVGENIGGNEELVRRMADEGHLIGVHCYSHQDLTRMTMEEACGQIEKTADMIEEITGKRPEYYRPPFGKGDGEMEDRLGMTPVLWDIDPRDWNVQNKNAVAAHIVKNAPRHRVALLHDVFKPSVEAALIVVDTLEAQGYTFVTADELEID